MAVQIDEVPGGKDTFVAMPHQDTNGHEAYDFVSEEGSVDGPYTDGGDPVLDDAQLTVDADDGSNQTDDDGGMGGTQDDGAGFGAVVALLAIVGSVLVAQRRS